MSDKVTRERMLGWLRDKQLEADDLQDGHAFDMVVAIRALILAQEGEMIMTHTWRRHGDFAWCEDCGAFEWRDEQGRRCTAFPHSLIAHGPEVSREFVEKWNKRIAESVNVQVITEVGEQSFDWDLVYPGSENLRAMLTEAGVTVKEGE